MCISRDKIAKQLFERGYEEMLNRVNPKNIIIYGENTNKLTQWVEQFTAGYGIPTRVYATKSELFRQRKSEMTIING